jgi:hypothetical protein
VKCPNGSRFGFLSIWLIGLAWSCALAAGFCPAAFCWESFPEFQSFSEAELESLGGPESLTAEYAADLWSYSQPADREYRWLSQEYGLHLGFGSLNTTRFLMNNRLKISRNLSRNLEFRFSYFDDSDLERHSVHHILELNLKLVPGVAVALYGEPAFRKPNDDTGIAILFHPAERHELRFYRTFVDVTRLKYPDGSGSFAEPELPYVIGVSGKTWQPAPWIYRPGNFFEYSLRSETPTRWRLPDSWGMKNDELFYWRWNGSIYSRRQVTESAAAAFRLEFDRKRYSRGRTGDWFVSRLSLLSESTVYDGDHREFTLGVEYAQRWWVASAGEGSYTDILPYGRLKLPAWNGPGFQGSWIAGYVMTWHREDGRPQIGIRPAWNGKIEQRLNLSYEFTFRDAGRIVLMGSVDVDEFGSRNTWDGGSGQVEVYF